MKKKTNDFLDALGKLLREYDASIVRSANSTNDLVVSVLIGPRDYEELTFPEEITEIGIRNEWFC